MSTSNTSNQVATPVANPNPERATIVLTGLGAGGRICKLPVEVEKSLTAPQVAQGIRASGVVGDWERSKGVIAVAFVCQEERADGPPEISVIQIPGGGEVVGSAAQTLSGDLQTDPGSAEDLRSVKSAFLSLDPADRTLLTERDLLAALSSAMSSR